MMQGKRPRKDDSEEWQPSVDDNSEPTDDSSSDESSSEDEDASKPGTRARGQSGPLVRAQEHEGMVGSIVQLLPLHVR